MSSRGQTKDHYIPYIVTARSHTSAHSQMQPYLRNEPTARVISGGINGFFLQNITAKDAKLDLSDLKYNTS